MKDETQAPDVAERVAALLSGESGMAALVELSDQQLAADPISFLYNTLTAEVAEARSDTEAWQQRHEELLVAVRGRIGLEQDRDLLEGLDALLARAAVADDVREELVAELLRQMTRAGLTFTEEHQRRLAAGLSAEELRAQATMYRESANRLYPPGRVTPEPTERRSTPMARVPASSYQG